MPRPKVLVFQHVPFEPLGTLDPLLKDAGFRIRYVNFGREPEQRPQLDRYEALIVLGGPMNADQINTYPNLLTEVEIIREAVEEGMSVLGICLGAQLLAKALGGSVSRNEVREIGWCNVEMTEAGLQDPVLSTFAPTQEVFQYDHGAVVRLDRHERRLDAARSLVGIDLLIRSLALVGRLNYQRLEPVRLAEPVDRFVQRDPVNPTEETA